MWRGVVRKTVCYWIAGCALTLLVAVVAYWCGESPIAKRCFVASIARGISPDFPDGSMWEWEEERSPFSVVVTSWVRSDDELKGYQFGRLSGFEMVERPRWWSYGMERMMPPVERLVRDHDVPFVVDHAYGWPVVSLSSRLAGPELLREMGDGRRADDGELLGVGSEGLPRAHIGWKHRESLSNWGWNNGVWPTRVLWPGVLFGGAWWGVLLAVPELVVRGRRAWKSAKSAKEGDSNGAGNHHASSVTGQRVLRVMSFGVASAIGFAVFASAFEETWPFRMKWDGRFAFGESELKENGRAWRWTVMESFGRTSVRSEIEDAARVEQWKGMSYEDGLATDGPAPWWSIPIERPVPPLIHGAFDEMMPNVEDDAFGFPWRCLARRIECYDIRFNKGMRGTPPVAAGMGRVSGLPLLVTGVRIEVPLFGGVVNSGWWPTRVLWPGLIGNALVWAVVWWAVFSARRGFVRFREERRRRRGECAGCRYALGAIAVGSRCPECGRVREMTRRAVMPAAGQNRT